MKLRVLIACEFSGVVRRAFQAQGHDTWSCDLKPSLDASKKHIIGDARRLLKERWDLMIAFPSCTRLANSGVRWLHEPPPGMTVEQMREELIQGAALFSAFLNADKKLIKRYAIENPVMHKHAKALIRNYREFDQSIQPWQFGHGEIKRTCLWLRELPHLQFSNVVKGRKPRIHYDNRWDQRVIFLPGIADAMASQWGSIHPNYKKPQDGRLF